MTNQPFRAGQPADTTHGLERDEGAKAKHEALLFGIVGIFFLGIVCGPLALMRAKKARSLGVKATTGTVLGWIDLVFGIVAVVGLVLNFS